MSKDFSGAMTEARALHRDTQRDVSDSITMLHLLNMKHFVHVRLFVCRLLKQLPASHLIYLRHIICVLHRIAVHSDSNNMTARNLSVCVAQNLLWPPRRTGL